MDAPRRGALIPRSAALCVVLYQFRLIAGELADTPVFAAGLLAAFALALLLPNEFHAESAPAASTRKSVASLLILLFFPWIVRLLVTLPRLFVGNPAGTDAVFWDSRLLHLDRNYFSLLVPYYWAALTTFFAKESRHFFRAEIIAADTLLVLLFSLASSRNIPAYSLPVAQIALFALAVFLQLASFILTPPPEYRARRGETIAAVGAVLALALIGGALFL
jgi:hypothetical protein